MTRKEGYITGKDVEHQILPPIQKKLIPSTTSPSNLKPKASGNPTDSKGKKYKNAGGVAGGNNKDAYQLLHPILRIFLSSTLKRAEGNPASIWTVKVTTEKEGEVVQKYQDFHVIVCWYSFLIGAIGGVAVGIETNFFSANRFPPPQIPLPNRLRLITKVAQFGVRNTSSFYRFGKRALISGYMFDVLEKNVEENRESQDWKNMGIAGGLTGAFFGLRGGLPGTFFGSLMFGGFASLAGFYYYYKKASREK